MNVPLIIALVGFGLTLAAAAWGSLKLAAKAGVLIEQVGEMRTSLAKWMERVQALEMWRGETRAAAEAVRELTGRHRVPVRDE